MAATKLASLVVDVAADISSIRGTLDQAGNKINSFASGATKALGALGIALSVTAVANYALELTEMAGGFVDLSDKMGVSIESVQRFKHAAEQGGSSLETVDKAITKMNANLAGGDKSVVKSLREAGLSFDDIRKMDPESAFLAISDAIAKVPDPMKQSELAMKLFGKSGAELLPAIKAGIKDVGDQTSVMSDETARALDEAGDTWQAFWNTVKIHSAEGLGAVMKTASWFKEGLRKDFENIGVAVLSTWDSMTEGNKDFTTALLEGAKVAAQVRKDQDMLATAEQTAAKKTAEATKEKKEADRAAAAAAAENAEKTKLKEDADKKAADAAKKHADEIRKLRSELTGLNDVDAAKKILEAAKGLDVTKLSAENTKQALDTLNDAIEALKANGKAVPADMQAMRDTLADIAAKANIAKAALEPIALLKVDPASERALGKITDEIDRNADASRKAAAEKEKQAAAEYQFWKNSSDYAEKQKTFQQDAAKATSEAWGKSLANISNGFAQMAQISGGSMGKVSSGIGTALSAVMTAKEGFNTLTTTIDAVKGVSGAASAIGGAASAGGAIAAGSGMLGMVSTIGLCATGVGAIVPVAMMAFKALNKVFGNAGRDMVKDYAKEVHGGFDSLQTKLQAFGAEGEAQWKKLTQGVGRNDKKAAEAAIKEVEAFLAAQDQKFNDSLNKQLTAISEFGGAIPDALQPYIDTLMKGQRVSEENIALMKTLGDGGEVSWTKMADAAEKYGIQQDALGESFHRQRLHDGYKELLDDLLMLVEGGADVNGVLAGMADEIADLVNDSRKFGVAIPENFRPYIEQLIASGQLLDENGEKISDINSLTFGAAIKDSMSELIDEIKKLVQTLGGVPDAINKIPKNVDINVNYRQSKSGDAPDGAPEPEHSYANGTNGFVNFGAGTLAMLHGEEMVIPRHKAASMLGGLNIGTIVVHAQTNATPEQIADALTTRLNQLGQRY